MKYDARSMSGAGLPYFTVSGGPLASSQIMGWHITNEKGFTVAVSNDAEFCKRLNELEELASLLKQADTKYHLSKRRDQGHLQLDDESWARLKTLLATLR